MLYCEELFFESLGETMVELADKVSEAAWKIKNLKDYDRRLERAARKFDEISSERHHERRRRQLVLRGRKPPRPDGQAARSVPAQGGPVQLRGRERGLETLGRWL